MTVLETAGDPFCLFIKLRFDFPEALFTTGRAEFDRIDLDLEGIGSFSWSKRVVEQTEHSLTYLLDVRNIDPASGGADGKTATVTFENPGQKVYADGDSIQLKLKGGQERIIIVDATGNINAAATPETVAALPAALDSTETLDAGFTVGRLTDGAQVITYDGAHGPQYLTVWKQDGVSHIAVGKNPFFRAALEGSWSQSWQISCPDPSLYWQGETGLFHPALTATAFRLSPLSWSMELTAREPIGAEAGLGLVPRMWDIQLRHRDGSLTDLTLHRGGSHERGKTDEASVTLTAMTVGDVFDSLLDLSDITAVVMEGAEFPLT